MDILHSLTSPTKIKSILFAKDYASNFSCCLVTQSYSNQLFVIPWTAVPPPPRAPLSMGFPRQEYCSGLPFPSPGDLPHPGIQPTSPELAGRFFTIAISDL